MADTVIRLTRAVNSDIGPQRKYTDLFFELEDLVVSSAVITASVSSAEC